MFFPREIWKIIKNYQLGQKYWRKKIRSCFSEPNSPIWFDYVSPPITLKDGIWSYYPSFGGFNIDNKNYYQDDTRNTIKKYVFYGRPYFKGYKLRKEYCYTNYKIEYN